MSKLTVDSGLECFGEETSLNASKPARESVADQAGFFIISTNCFRHYSVLLSVVFFVKAVPFSINTSTTCIHELE